MSRRYSRFRNFSWFAASVATMCFAGNAAGQARPATQVRGYDMSAFKKPSDSELKQRLNPLQYQVTQHEGTERPFQMRFIPASQLVEAGYGECASLFQNAKK